MLGLWGARSWDDQSKDVCGGLDPYPGGFVHSSLPLCTRPSRTPPPSPGSGIPERGGRSKAYLAPCHPFLSGGRSMGGMM